MKIFILTIVIFSLNVYVTRATSLDPVDHVEMEQHTEDKIDGSRNRRSGEFFSSLLKKKFGLISTLTGVSAGKAMGNPVPEHYEQHEPLTYHTKSFNLWGVKKAILGSVFQAAKAITGGVLAIKGQLLKAKGHAVVAKGKLLQTKGDAITVFGKNVATHAFDVHPQPHIDVPSAVGLFNHLPVTPIHQPTSYGAPVGYQGQLYPGNGYANNLYSGNGYPGNGFVSSAGYPAGYIAPSAGFDGSADFSGYSGSGLTAKRAVQKTSQESDTNQMENGSNKDPIRAGLLIYKPIKSSQTATNSAESNIRQAISLRQSSAQQNAGFLQNMFTGLKTLSQSNGYQGAQPVGGYQTGQSMNGYSLYQNPSLMQTSGLSSQGAHQFPATGTGSGSSSSVEQIQSQEFGQLPNYNFQQPLSSQEFNQQMVAAFPVSHTPFTHDMNNNFGSDLHNSASNTDDHFVPSAFKSGYLVEKPKQKVKSGLYASDYFMSTTKGYGSDEPSKYSKKRSAPKVDNRSSTEAPSHGDSIVPLKYHDDMNPENQAKLKQTVERFFSMLQKNPWVHLAFRFLDFKIVHETRTTARRIIQTNQT